MTMQPNIDSAGANADYAGQFALSVSGWRKSPAAWRSFCSTVRRMEGSQQSTNDTE
jgi:hypothetical protein